MKALIFAAVLAVSWQAASLAQGTLEFQNASVGVNAPVYHSDGVTKLSGSQFLAELLVGMDSVSLAPVATTGFRTGNGAGYFVGAYQTIPTISPGVTAFVRVEVWNTASGASFSAAQASGLPDSWWAWPIFTVVLGGGNVNPPNPPAPLTGLGNSPVYLNSVPEPSTFVLSGLGAVFILLFARRRTPAQISVMSR